MAQLPDGSVEAQQGLLVKCKVFRAVTSFLQLL